MLCSFYRSDSKIWLSSSFLRYLRDRFRVVPFLCSRFWFCLSKRFCSMTGVLSSLFDWAFCSGFWTLATFSRLYLSRRSFLSPVIWLTMKLSFLRSFFSSSLISPPLFCKVLLAPTALPAFGNLFRRCWSHKSISVISCLLSSGFTAATLALVGAATGGP